MHREAPRKWAQQLRMLPERKGPGSPNTLQAALSTLLSDHFRQISAQNHHHRAVAQVWLDMGAEHVLGLCIPPQRVSEFQEGWWPKSYTFFVATAKVNCFSCVFTVIRKCQKSPFLGRDIILHAGSHEASPLNVVQHWQKQEKSDIQGLPAV